ncbi:LmbU family transcriptional regulator [Nonomuraea typhae]|uniref:LmbU family transcriptional regulator n=1 Tax=Nonomuraea typhae TaxID=2603600 RepID=UPI001CA4AE80|nr:LmbU family transcriptional regulator [Nonomuraea typhae]
MLTRRAALILPDTLALETWFEIGHEIAVISDASAWWLADWLIYGQHRYPHRYRKAIEQTSLDYQTLRNYAWVARKFPVSRRRDTLSFQHHAEVASLPEPEQDLWLERAQRCNWSRAVLRRELRRARAANAGADEAVRAQVFQMQIELERQDLWQAAASRAGYALDAWVMLVLDRAAGEVLAPDAVTAAAQAAMSAADRRALRAHDAAGQVSNGHAAVRHSGITAPWSRKADDGQAAGARE